MIIIKLIVVISLFRYNYNFNIVKNERVDKIHLEEKIQQLTTIIKHQINKNKKMDNLIKLFKNHQQKCPFYLEELIHIVN